MAAKNLNISGMSKGLTQSISEDIKKEEAEVKRPLEDKKIGISVSDSEDFHQLGFSKIHQRDLTIEFARYLLVNGAHLVYGGDLRSDGYTYAFSDLAFQYRTKQDHNKMYFTNFFGWPIHLNIQKSDEATFKKNRVEVKKISAPDEVPRSLEQTFIHADTLDNKFYWALSMTKMRKEAASFVDSRIAIGGRLNEYKGFYPGIVEEIYLAIQKRQPIYLVGAFDGATGLIIRALKGESINRLVGELHERNSDLEKLWQYAANRYALLDVKELLNSFKKLGTRGLAKLNGLSMKENDILFNTIHFHEIIYYTLLGLKRSLND